MTFFSLIFSIFLSFAAGSGQGQHSSVSSHVHSAPVRPSAGTQPTRSGGGNYGCGDNGGMPLC